MSWNFPQISRMQRTRQNSKQCSKETAAWFGSAFGSFQVGWFLLSCLFLGELVGSWWVTLFIFGLVLVWGWLVAGFVVVVLGVVDLFF